MDPRPLASADPRMPDTASTVHVKRRLSTTCVTMTNDGQRVAVLLHRVMSRLLRCFTYEMPGGARVQELKADAPAAIWSHAYRGLTSSLVYSKACLHHDLMVCAEWGSWMMLDSKMLGNTHGKKPSEELLLLLSIHLCLEACRNGHPRHTKLCYPAEDVHTVPEIPVQSICPAE